MDDQLQEFFNAGQQQLIRAARDARSPMRTPGLATGSQSGPELRTVVLREYDVASNGFLFYTDVRSAKVRQIRSLPNGMALFWHPRQKIQVRVRGILEIVDSEPERREHWTRLTVPGRRAYGTIQPPGSQLPAADDGLPASWQNPDLDPHETDYTFEHFAILRLIGTEQDHLHLDRQGHRRAKFQFMDRRWQGQWVVP